MSGGFSAVLSGAAPVSKILIICLVPGVVLSAAYMLRLLQKVAYGGTRNPDHSLLRDLGLREVLTLVPLLVFVFWIGLHPAPFTRVLHTSVERLLERTQQTTSAYANTKPKPAGSLAER